MVNLKGLCVAGTVMMALFSMNLDILDVSATSQKAESSAYSQNSGKAKDPAVIAQSDQRYRGHIVDYKTYVSNEKNQQSEKQQEEEK